MNLSEQVISLGVQVDSSGYGIRVPALVISPGHALA
jgi:hypothetical protein